MMRRPASFCAIAISLMMLASPASAMTPSERLDDPALERRARSISAELRCMVCQNQSIDDSDAELARDLRVLVRERIASGETDEEVMAYVVSRYGEFVLLRPRFNARNALLWSSPLLLLLIGSGVVYLYARRRPSTSAGLSAEEEERLRRVLDERH